MTTMNKFEVSARMKVKTGQLDGFKKQAGEIIRLAREHDTRTLRYDWFLSDDETECEIREAYVDADGFLEHRENVDDALNRLFTEFAEAHNVTVYGEPSKALVDFAAANMPPGSVSWYRFLDGIEAEPTVTPPSSNR
jgi:quinol monooxygenase YgiN